MRTTIYRMAIISFIATLTAVAHAEERQWISVGSGTTTVPNDWFDDTNWFESDKTTPASVPVDGDSIVVYNATTTVFYTTIDNGGSGVNLPNSNILFDDKWNIFDDSAGDLSDIIGGSYNDAAVDDDLIANEIAFNGNGGTGISVYVPVIANTFTSNRHGAQFYAPITVNTILANSNHQDKWNINVSPTGTIDLIELDENRNADGDSVDGYFAFNADTAVNTIDHVWSSLRVGSGATLTVEKLNYWDYRNQAINNNITPIVLNGNIEAWCFNVFDVEASSETPLPVGTYGRIGHGGVDNEVEWITSGDGILTVSSLTCHSFLTLTKDPINDNDGSALPDDFQLKAGPLAATSGISISGITSNTDYLLSETQVDGYTFVNVVCTSDINDSGNAGTFTSMPTLNLAEGENVSCTITNDDIEPSECYTAKATNGNVVTFCL